MENTKVSVGITYYNQIDDVYRSIKSVLDQVTTFSFEILIGDDGSNDGTWEKVLEWENRYPGIIKAFQRRRDDGVSATGFRASRNRLNLLEKFRGEYFTFLDGDDYYIDRMKLQQQVDILDNESNRDCMVCAHDIMYVYKDGKKKAKYGNKLKEGRYNGKEYWKKWYFHTNTELIRKTAMDGLDIDLIANNYNDNYITFLSFQKGSIYYIPKAMAAYVQTGKGIWTGQKRIINLIRNMYICDLIYNHNPSYKRETDIRFRGTWIELFRSRKDINDKYLEMYNREAEDKELKYSLRIKMISVEIEYRLFKITDQ